MVFNLPELGFSFISEDSKTEPRRLALWATRSQSSGKGGCRECHCGSRYGCVLPPVVGCAYHSAPLKWRGPCLRICSTESTRAYCIVFKQMY